MVKPMLSVSKYHVAGNSFALVESEGYEGCDWGKLAVSLCKHRYGIGADGLLVITIGGDDCDFEMRMFNPDGTEDGCGNGLICATRFFYERMSQMSGDMPSSFIARTIWGKSNVRIVNPDPFKFIVDAELVEPKWHPSEIPMIGIAEPAMANEPIEVTLNIFGTSVKFIPVNTGSTHVVIFPDGGIEDLAWEVISAQIESHPMFPKRTSIMWAKVVNQIEVRVRSYERGVGETLSCGTGACAVLAVGTKLGLLSNAVKVNFKGGSVEVFMDDSGKVHLQGQSYHVFDAKLPASILYRWGE